MICRRDAPDARCRDVPAASDRMPPPPTATDRMSPPHRTDVSPPLNDKQPSNSQNHHPGQHRRRSDTRQSAAPQLPPCGQMHHHPADKSVHSYHSANGGNDPTPPPTVSGQTPHHRADPGIRREMTTYPSGGHICDRRRTLGEVTGGATCKARTPSSPPL